MHFGTRFSVNRHLGLRCSSSLKTRFTPKVGVVVLYTLTGLFQFIFLGGLLRAHRCIAPAGLGDLARVQGDAGAHGALRGV